MADKPLAYGYGRASTLEQNDTILLQEAACKAQFRKELEKTHEWGGMFVDRGVSGSIGLRQRPEGGRLMNLLNGGDAVIIFKMDRGFRNAKDALETMDWLILKKVRLMVLDFGLDPLTPVGRMVATMLALFAEWERSRICERIKEAKAQRSILGLPNNGKSPYGFKIVGPRLGRRFAPDPEVRKFGRKFMEWFDAGWSLDAIYFHCLKERIYQRNGEEWARSTIDRAITGERIIQATEQARALAGAEEVDDSDIDNSMEED